LCSNEFGVRRQATVSETVSKMAGANATGHNSTNLH